MTFVNGGGLGFGPVGLPNAVGDGVQGNANIAPDITGLLQRMQDPVKLTQKVGEKFGDKPDQIQKLLTQLQQLGRPLKPDENLLKELLQLLLHAIQTGQLPQFLQSMGQGGGLGGLMNGLRGGGGGGGGGGGQNLGRALGGLLRGGGGGFGGGGGGGGGVNFNNFRPWSDADRQFLNQSIQSDPVHFKNQNASWGQGQEGNCAAIGTIKAAMDRYDNQVFNAVTAAGDGYKLEMQDGFKLSLNGQELAMGRGSSHIHGTDNEAKTYAQLCYCAMAKRALMEGHEGSRSYAGALAALNNGDYPRHSAELLGLKDKIVNVDPRTLNGQDSCVGWNGSHCVFVDRDQNGRHIADHYGRPVRFNGTDTNGRRLTDAFTLKPRATGTEWRTPRQENSPRGYQRARPQAKAKAATPRKAPPPKPKTKPAQRR